MEYTALEVNIVSDKNMVLANSFRQSLASQCFVTISNIFKGPLKGLGFPASEITEWLLYQFPNCSKIFGQFIRPNQC